MKTILTALLALSTLTAFAQNEGPQAAPIYVKAVAELSRSAGFVPPTVASSHVIQILSNGEVRSTDYYQNGQTVTKTLATLSADVMNKLLIEIKDVKPGQLVDTAPGNPSCYDAPMTSYSVVTSRDVKLTFAQRMDCKDYVSTSASSSDHTLKRILDSMDSLAALP